MNAKTKSRRPAANGFRRRMLPVMAGFLATMLALPGAAVTFPADPLQSGTPYPPANIMFILDDSGSMDFTQLPDDPPSVSPSDISLLAYTRNTLSYNPNTTYLPWIQATTANTFVRVSGGTDYTDAYSDLEYVDDGTNSSGQIDLSSSTRTFYVPKAANLDEAQTASYYRYQILSTGQIIRSEWASSGATGQTIDITAIPTTVLGGTTAQNTWWSGTTGTTAPSTYTVDVPSGASNFTVTIAGADADANLYVRRNSLPTTGTGICPGSDTDSNETCSINNPTAGTYYIGVRAANVNAASGFTGVTLTATYSFDEGCSNPGAGVNGWRLCTQMTPTGRSEADEKTNYATWYSYHRTRTKAAKAGAAEAFSKLGSSLRVGFDSIWNRYPPSDIDSTVGTTPRYPIPVSSDGGLFRDNGTSHNRSDWWKRLFGAIADQGTPLRSALARTGHYFTDETVTGPWGPALLPAPNQLMSCRQSFAILTTDGYWNGDSGFTGNNGTSGVGDADSTLTNSGTDDVTWQNPSITDTHGGSFTYLPSNPYKDNPSPAGTRSNTLADVAMYYWKNDLAQTNAGMINNVPASAVDSAYWQHMVTFGISLGALGTLDPEVDLPALTAGSKHWPNPFDNSAANGSGNGGPYNIDDLWHASINGHGSFVAATSPAAFAKALSDALALIGARRGSASNVATNSTSIQANTRVFQARYLSQRWTGELAAYVVSAAGIGAEPTWQASQMIPGSRTIRTWNGSAGAAFPTAAQITALDQSARANSAVSGANNAAYIAGTTTLESRNGGTLRDREISVRQSGNDVLLPTVLGDIVDSTPSYVKELETVFVGANDGMLHAFDALTGVEKFAYVPGGIDYAALSTLSDPEYGKVAVPHTYFVDGQVAVSSTALTPSHNYLVGALGRGGKGVFGLEVTNPSSFTNSNVLWETASWASTADKNDMGNVLGEPVIVKLNDPSNTRAVLVPNGVNSVNGHAVLFVINLTTGAVIKKFDTGAGTIGMSAPRAWDNDGNGTVDYVYAGDLNGNLWKFDLTDATASYATNWKIALLGAPLYVARDASNVRQPITAGLALAREPVSGDRWIFIGTGKFLESPDMTTTTVQSMYGIIDDGVSAVTGRTSGGNGNLQQRSIIITGQVRIDTDGDGDTNQVPAGTDNQFRDVRGFETNDTLAAGKTGWYIDLVKPPIPTLQGERIVSAPRINGTVLLTASIIPPSAGSCDATGSGYINALDAFSGSSTAAAFFNANGTYVGTVANFSDDTLTSGGTTVPIGSVDLGLGMPTLPTMVDTLLIAGGSAGTIGSVTVNPQGPGARRVMWREIKKD